MGLLDSLFGNGGRRFIKRKDSDAGEAGEALFAPFFIGFQTIIILFAFVILITVNFKSQ